MFPEDPTTAVAVARCESGLVPNAYNGSNTNGTADVGLFQINTVHHDRMARLGLDPWSVEDNVTFARMLYKEEGWRPWVCWWSEDHLAMGQ